MSGSGTNTLRPLIAFLCAALWPFAVDAAVGPGWPDWGLHRWVVWLTGVAFLWLVFLAAESYAARAQRFSRPVRP